MLLNGVYLIDEGAEEAFREEVTALAAEFEPRRIGRAERPVAALQLRQGSIEAAR